MSLGFGQALLLWGTLLVGVPVLIHLLNRRRYVVRSFAAMEFLRRAYAHRRRRLRMENLLLLLLRCLIVAVAALAMALPFVPSDSPLAVLSSGRRDVVLIVDRSGSMGREVSRDTTVDDRTLEMVRRQIGRLSAEHGDAVTLVTLGNGPLHPAPIAATPDQAMAALDAGLPPPGGLADMVGAARLLRDGVAPFHGGRLDVQVFTDLQELSWSEQVGRVFAEALGDDGTLRIIDVAGDSDQVRNVGVTSLSAAEPLLVAGRAVDFDAVVRNHGDATLHGVGATFRLDGEIRRRVDDIELPPRGTTVVSLRLRLDEPGPHHLEFALEADDLPFDDRRTLAFEVAERVEVLLVDGGHSARRLDRATGFLELALDPSAGPVTGDDVQSGVFSSEVVDVRAFEEAGRELYRYDAIVLADVGGVSEAAAATLAEVVQTGTPLLVFTGPRVVPRLYAERLGPLGLLPAGIGDPLGDPDGSAGEDDYVSLVLPDPPPAALDLFADPRLAVLLQVPVLAWNELTPREDAEVLASFADALGETTPAIVSGELGLGRTLVVGTTADDTWSLLPRHPATWLPLVHELVSSLVADDPDVVNVPVGHVPSFVLDGRPSRARLVAPSGAVVDIASPQVEPLGVRSRLSLAGTPLREAGAWSLAVDFTDPSRPSRTLALSARPDAREGDLRRLDDSVLAQRLEGVDFVMGEAGDAADEAADAGGGDGSLFRLLLWVLLVLVVGEPVLARTMGAAR